MFKLTLLGFTLFILGCDDDILSTGRGDSEDRVHGSVHGIVTNNNTGAQLQNVKVSWITNGMEDSVFTDENGFYSITELIPGEYRLIFTDNDTTASYAVSAETIEINKLSDLVAIAGSTTKHYENEPDGGYYIEVTTDVKMYTINASAKGYVYVTMDDENTAPVNAGVTVDLMYDESQGTPPTALNLLQHLYTTTTDTLGMYSFTNVPAGLRAKVRVLSYSDTTYVYDGDTKNSVDLIANYTTQVEAIKISDKIGPKPILLSNNFGNDDFQVNENITGTFNEAIDYGNYAFAMTLNNVPGNHSGDYIVTWSADSKTFTIDPDEPLKLGQTYTITISGNTVAGVAFPDPTAYSFDAQKGVEETSSTLESYDMSGNIIGKSDAIVFTFSETLATTGFDDMVYKVLGCNNPVFTTEAACDEGGGVWNWITGTADCNVTVNQWDFATQQTVTTCYGGTYSSTNNTVTLSFPTDGWGYKCVDVVDPDTGVANGACDTEEAADATYPDITVIYKYASTLATYDVVTKSNTIAIED